MEKEIHWCLSNRVKDVLTTNSLRRHSRCRDSVLVVPLKTEEGSTVDSVIVMLCGLRLLIFPSPSPSCLLSIIHLVGHGSWWGWVKKLLRGKCSWPSHQTYVLLLSQTSIKCETLKQNVQALSGNVSVRRPKQGWGKLGLAFFSRSCDIIHGSLVCRVTMLHYLDRERYKWRYKIC